MDWELGRRERELGRDGEREQQINSEVPTCK